MSERIIIREIDATTNPSLEVGTDIVYIPGLSQNTALAGKGPILYRTTEEFENAVGKYPYAFEADEEVGQEDSIWKVSVKTGDFDKSYIYAKELLSLGLPVYYEVVDTNVGTDSGALVVLPKLNGFYYALTNCYKNLRDKGEYSVKYITSGGYPTVGISDDLTMEMVKCAASRGDSVAILDVPKSDEAPLMGEGSAYEYLVNLFSGNSKVMEGTLEFKVNDETFTYGTIGTYATAFTPWMTYKTRLTYIASEGATTLVNECDAAPSFLYMYCLANAIKTNPNWFSIAGVNRGLVPQNKNTIQYTKTRLSNLIADEMQPRIKVAINPITMVRPYGYAIWGNRTLFDNALTSNGKDGLVARSFLNIRNTVSDIKKELFIAAKSLMFEQNTSILWTNFKLKVSPLLDRMTSGGGITSYSIKKDETSERGKVVAKVTITPVYAVENWDITVVITDEDVTVE